jgi:hypothetical protein
VLEICLKDSKGDAKPAADLLGQRLGVGSHSVGHHLPPVLRGQGYLDSGVHPLAEARAYRWEFRPATPLRAVTPVRLPS